MQWKSRFSKVPTQVRLGVAAAVVLFISVAVFNAISLPWEGTADSKFHVDYTYQVSKNTLPEPYGMMFAPDNPGSTEKFHKQSRQYASAHPPLYYYVNSLFVGDLLNEGRYKKAIFLMRTINIFVGVLMLLVLAIGAWFILPSRWYRDELTIALPAIAVLISAFVKVSADVYNDALAALFSVIAMVLVCLIIKRGPSKRLLFGLAMVLSLGMLTKATTIATLLVACVAVLLGYILRNSNGPSRGDYFKGIAAAMSIVLVVLVSSSWFYMRNYQESGSWFRSTEKAQLQDRKYKSVGHNLTSRNYWTVVSAKLLDTREWEGMLKGNQIVSNSIFFLCLGAILIFVTWNRKRIMTIDKRMAAVVGLIILQLVLFFGVQLQHATGWGQISARYFLPAIISIGLVLSLGSLLITKRLYYQGVTVVMAILCLAGIIHSSWYLTYAYPDRFNGSGFIERIAESTSQNGFTDAILVMLIMAMGASLAIVSYVLYSLNKRHD